MIKWLLKKSIWGIEARKWHGMSHDDESDVLRTSNSCSTWLGPHLFFGHFYIIFWSFWEAHKVKKLKYYNILFVPSGTQRVLVNISWTHHVLHLFLVEWGTLFMGDLVHFGTLWLYEYRSMYCMLSSSQPLIRTLISFNLSHSFWKWLGFWFSHFYLKERASHL